MMRLLFISAPESFYLPLEQYLLKKGYEIIISESSEAAKNQIQSGEFDTYIIEPFSNSTVGASFIKLLKEWNLLDRAILILPGLTNSEELSAKKIVNNNYISINDSFAIVEEKIVQIISSHRKDVNFPLFLHKPVVQYIKSEIEKSKRGRTSLSFIYYRIQDSIIDSKETSSILQKVNTSVNYRLRISDDAFPFHKGILILLFGTHAQDRYIIANAIQKRLRRSLKSFNIDIENYFELSEATYPDDGNSYQEIMKILDDAKLKSSWKDQTGSGNIVSEIFQNPITHQNLFRLKRRLKEIEATTANTYLDTSYLAPTWYGTLLQLCREDATTPRMIEEFITNETNIGERLLQLSCGLIQVFHERYKADYKNIPQSLKEACLILGNEEFKNLISLCTLENSVLHGSATDLSVLKEIIFSQMAMALELSKKLDYQNKSELLLCTFSQAVGFILIKRKNAEKFFNVHEQQKQTNEPISKIFYSELGFTPSELTWLYLNVWGLEETMIESAHCVRYENTPQLNPQLTAITHLSVVLSNHISGLGLEHNLKIAKISLDEIQLRNRNLKTDSLHYLSDNYETWMQDYNFIFP